eukprot:2899238-Amphidinium_carterae.1
MALHVAAARQCPYECTQMERSGKAKHIEWVHSASSAPHTQNPACSTRGTSPALDSAQSIQIPAKNLVKKCIAQLMARAQSMGPAHPSRISAKSAGFVPLDLRKAATTTTTPPLMLTRNKQQQHAQLQQQQQQEPSDPAGWKAHPLNLDYAVNIGEPPSCLAGRCLGSNMHSPSNHARQTCRLSKHPQMTTAWQPRRDAPMQDAGCPAS